MTLIAIVCVSLVLFAQAAVAASSDYPVSECDRRAANPEDQDIVAPAVPREKMDLPKAIAACEAETAKNPENARAHYQLASPALPLWGVAPSIKSGGTKVESSEWARSAFCTMASPTWVGAAPHGGAGSSGGSPTGRSPSSSR